MRWLFLYARSRHMPLVLLSMVLGTVTVTALAWTGVQNPADPRLPVLALTAGIGAASIGLGGQDVWLDRTAAVRWVPRRAVHTLSIGIVAGTVMMAFRAVDDTATPFVIARASSGLAGLAAIGAALCGAPHAWVTPFSWCAVAYFVPPSQEATGELVAWMIQPADSALSTWTSVVLAVTGVLAYALAGPRPLLSGR
ncbi:hypothetical protein [Streptomyces sp. NPDC001675]